MKFLQFQMCLKYNCFGSFISFLVPFIRLDGEEWEGAKVREDYSVMGHYYLRYLIIVIASIIDFSLLKFYNIIK